MREEAKLQKRIVQFFKKYYDKYLIFSVPNEATHNGNNFQASGVLRGAPDLILVLPNNIIFLELKTEKGKLSDYQCIFKTKCSVLNAPYFIIRDFNDFQNILHNFLPVNEWITEDNLNI